MALDIILAIFTSILSLILAFGTIYFIVKDNQLFQSAGGFVFSYAMTMFVISINTLLWICL
jgi:hypothetical protein